MSTDWKRGDRFTIEFEIDDVDSFGCVRTSIGQRVHRDDMARAVKLPPKARPVRKGDEIIWTESKNKRTFVAIVGSRIVVIDEEHRRPALTVDFDEGDGYTHADGAPIDWEASE